MLNQQELKSLMESHSNDKLVSIVTKEKGDYSEEAIIAAKEEISQRGIKYDTGSSNEDKDYLAEEIEDRLRSGEQHESIESDLNNRGIDTVDEHESTEFGSRSTQEIINNGIQSRENPKEVFDKVILNQADAYNVMLRYLKRKVKRHNTWGWFWLGFGLIRITACSISVSLGGVFPSEFVAILQSIATLAMLMYGSHRLTLKAKSKKFMDELEMFE